MEGTWVTNNCDKLWKKSLNHLALDCTTPSSVHISIETKPTNTLLGLSFLARCYGVDAEVESSVLSAAGRSHRVNRLGKHPDKKPRHHAGQYTIVTPTVGDEETQWPILSLPGVKQTCKQCLTMFGKVEYEFILLLIFLNIVIQKWWRWPKVDKWKPYCR